MITRRTIPSTTSLKNVKGTTQTTKMTLSYRTRLAQPHKGRAGHPPLSPRTKYCRLKTNSAINKKRADPQQVNTDKKDKYANIQNAVESYIKSSQEEAKIVMLQHEIDGVKHELDDSLKKKKLSYKLKSAQKQDLSKKSDSSSQLCRKLSNRLGYC